MIDINSLKKFKAKAVNGPEICSGDRKWSEVFEEVAKKFDEKRAFYGICREFWGIEGVPSGQVKRMVNYMCELLDDHSHVNGWLYTKNKKCFSNTQLLEYRAAWARHLASQFRSKGL